MLTILKGISRHLPCLGACLLAAAINCQAQETTGTPTFVTCVDIGDCRGGIIGLSVDERNVLNSLLSYIKSSTTEEQVNRAYIPIPKSKTEPTQAIGRAAGVLTTKASWYLDKKDAAGDSGQSFIRRHLDVYFLNGEAYAFKFWMSGVSRCVDVTLSEK